METHQPPVIPLLDASLSE